MTVTETHPAPTAAPVTAALTAGSKLASPRDFADGLKAVLLAASKDQVRAVLTGVQIGRNTDREVIDGAHQLAAPDQLTMVATDSYRLHRVDVTVGDELAAMFADPVLLPAADLANVAKMLAGRNVTVATVTVTDPTPADRFADAIADLEAAGTYSAVRSTTERYMSGDYRRRVTFEAAGSAVTVTEMHGEYPRWEQLLPNLEECHGGDVVGLNPTYLASIAKAADLIGERGVTPIRCHGAAEGSPLKPQVFSAIGDGVRFTGLLMPVRLP